MMAPSFSDADDEILVEEVANHPSLWQLSNAFYKDLRLKDNIWAEIANKVGKPIDQCKKRWRNIKDTYDRKKRKNSGSAATPTKSRKWALEEKLSFLRTSEEHRGTITNLNMSQEKEVDSPGTGDEQISLMETSTPTLNSPTHTTTTTNTLTTPPTTMPIPSSNTTTHRGKRSNNREKIVDILEKRQSERNDILRALLVEEKEDEVDLFFKSLAKSVKKLTPALQQRAKIETLHVITRLETEMTESLQYGSYCISNDLSSCSNTSATVAPQSSSPNCEAGYSDQSSTLTELISFSQPQIPSEHPKSFAVGDELLN